MRKTIKGIAAPLPLANVDTDVIMPKRFLRTITREGLAAGTFAALRFYNDNSLRQDFVLNQEPWKAANILVVGDNFGCGSSREHAVWGLRQMGIEAIIGTSFAGIFFDNARKNGLALPIITSEKRDLLLKLSRNGKIFSVSVENKIVDIDGQEVHFMMDDATQTALLEGRDDTLESLKKSEAIDAFENSMSLKEKVSVIK